MKFRKLLSVVEILDVGIDLEYIWSESAINEADKNVAEAPSKQIRLHNARLR